MYDRLELLIDPIGNDREAAAEPIRGHRGLLAISLDVETAVRSTDEQGRQALDVVRALLHINVKVHGGGQLRPRSRRGGAHRAPPIAVTVACFCRCSRSACLAAPRSSPWIRSMRSGGMPEPSGVVPVLLDALYDPEYRVKLVR